ncbi:hypothetical protein V8F20_012449 [Naviculisporaceae sp. PSN 640]
MAAPIPQVACLPMKLECLVMNDKVGENEEVKVAPIAQPNYTFLRLDNETIQNDVLPFTDLDYTSPVERNQRLTDLGTGLRRENREGVYVSWTLPRAYRMGASGTETASSSSKRSQQGYQPIDGPADYSAPDFRPAPPRWLIVRYLDLKTLQTPKEYPISDDEKAKLQFQGWVLDSDRLSYLKDIPLQTDDNSRNIDLQTDFSPFIKAERNNSNDQIEQQAEVFVGYKTPVSCWAEDLTRPSVPLSLLNSANHLFPDYQPHNSNVFSMIDEMTYMATDGNLHKISTADVSYYVLGWHPGDTDGPSPNNPFYFDANLKDTHRSDRLGDLAMAMKDSTVGGAAAWESATTSADILCHGAMYGVQWSNDGAPPDDKAQLAATAISEKSPIALGTSSADALITLIKAHVADDTGALKELEKDIIAIQTLILAQDDGVDANMQASDLLESYSFQKQDGGSQWHLGTADSSQPTFTPTDAQSKALQTLNDLQAAVDNNKRTMDRISWDLFSIWWKWVSGFTPQSDASNTLSAVQVQSTRWKNLKTKNDTLNADIRSQAASLSAKKGTNTAFSQRKDPTLLVGGVQAGWPHDYLDPLQIRVETQTVKSSDIQTAPGWGPEYDSFVNDVQAKLPVGLQTAATNLMTEFSLLYGSPSVSTKDCVLPLYHDSDETPGLWRDTWTVQPWFPLFIEWQAQYYHVEYDNFNLQKRDSGDHNSSVIRWGIRDGIDLSNPPPTDLRSVSGRCLVLPQPTFSLATAVNQLITNMGSTLPLPADEIAFLKDKSNYNRLPFLSSTMTGLTPHLTTRIAGAHIKPTQRPRGEQLTATAAATSAASAIGMTDSVIADIIGKNTGLTPYGDSVQLDEGPGPGLGPSPFKPATHGQLRFTQINIIDKFGRAICVLDPSPTKKGRLHVAPCLSDIYTCQTLNAPPTRASSSQPLLTETPQTQTGRTPPPPPVPNTVYHDMPPPACEFAQIPPSINQPARMNLVFCKPDPEHPTQWKPMNDWETPAYGWVVMNYADYGMQFFTSDGTFYRELRFGGPNGFVESPPWAPYGRPPTPPQLTQLDMVINALTASGSPGYLQAFYNMITLAFGEMKPADSSYAQYVNSITGRPLALVNIGMSLELAAYELSNESNVDGYQYNTLLPRHNTPSTAAVPSPTATAAHDQTSATPPTPVQYSFPLQLGDQQRSYDGLVAFWKPPKSPSPTSSTPPLEASFDYQNLYTFWPDTKTSPSVHPIDPSTLKLEPFISPPDILQPDNKTYKLVDPATQQLARNAALRVVSALIDPFQDIHAFCATLPTVSIKLPRWATEAALNKMTAFFHVGPVLLTTPPPGFKSEYQLTPASDVKNAPVAGSIGLPALNKGLWRWLQPYPPTSGGTREKGGEEEKAGEGGGAGDDPPPPPNYMPLSLLTADSRPRFEAAPYVAVEGYLQLAEPLTTAQDVEPKPPTRVGA